MWSAPSFLFGILVGLALAAPVIVLLTRKAARRVREAERRARGSQRLAEIGMLTGGLAHEIKNPLSTIGLNAQLLVEEIQDLDLQEDERGRVIRRIESLRRETDRLRDILTDFLQFAGRVRIDPQPADINEIIDELADFYLAQATQAGVTLRVQPAEQPVLASVDRTLIKQAILNLMINATQAMSEINNQSAFGVPSADSDSKANNSMELILRVEPASDRENSVQIHIIDTGPGIEPEKIDSIFHPYFTTKSGGTGLGLSTALRIVEEHGGTINVVSKPGSGSDFIITLPAD